MTSNTITIQIGNSDDKLSQAQWAAYIMEVTETIKRYVGCQTHFFACSAGSETWQNAAWVIECGSAVVREALRHELAKIRGLYGQTSVAWTEGATQFI